MDRPTESDAELMMQFVGGEETAFRELVDRYRQPLVNFLFRQCWNRDQAEDLAQEVFIRLYEHKDQFRPGAGSRLDGKPGTFRTYLFRIATNLWIDTCRREGRRPRPLSLDRPVGAEEKSALSDMVVDPERTPQTAFDRRELMDAIRRAIDTLPIEQRMVFDLSESQGLKYSEIALALDIPVGTVKSRMFLAVRKLQGLLGRVAGAWRPTPTDPEAGEAKPGRGA